MKESTRKAIMMLSEALRSELSQSGRLLTEIFKPGTKIDLGDAVLEVVAHGGICRITEKEGEPCPDLPQS